WTDPAVAGRAIDPPLLLTYSATGTPSPAKGACSPNWTPGCRIILHYPDHIQPLWDKNRGNDTCILCHATRDANGILQVPAGQLDLSGSASPDQADHLTSYRELLFPDNVQILNMGALQDQLVQATDANGQPLFQTDNNGNLILDNSGNPIPVMITVPVAPVMSTNGAASSPRFFSLFQTGGTHQGRLSPDELRLISEWLDIGAQYYNNPFSAPAL
ncbi:MAG: hypothetical protein D6698_00490, partial [Gammaproteobacteria bacterium]